MTKEDLIADLSQLLADSYVFYTKLQNFHWNVSGIHFGSLHAFFQDQYEDLAIAIDSIAEQIRTLQGVPPGSLKEFLALAQIQECEVLIKPDEMLRQALNDHELLVANLKVYIERASQAGEEGTADLMVGRLQAHDKTAWMVRAHLS